MNEKINKEKYIELNTYIKIKGLASSGGDAKQLIRSKQILLNGEIETRNKKKIRVGDIISFKDQTYLVEDGEIQ